MKLLLSLFCFLWHLVLSAQSIGLRAGHSLMPADHVSLHYEHWANGGINLAGSVFLERSRANALNYSCYGIDLLGEYANNPENETMFGWRIGFGGTIQNENEPWLYKNLSFGRRLNFGLVGEAGIEYWLSENFRISLFSQQKILFHRQLGTAAFLFGLGLFIRLSE